MNDSYHCSSKTPLQVFDGLAKEATVATIQVRYRKDSDDFLVSVKRDVYSGKPEITFGSGGSAEKAVSNVMMLIDTGRAIWRKDNASK